MTDRDEKLVQAEDLQNSGRLEEAERLCREILALGPDDADALWRLASILGQRGDLEAAQEKLRQAARLRPDSVEIAKHLRRLLAAKEFRLGLVLAKQRRVDDAAACMRRAVAHAPDFVEAHRSLGILLAGQERFAEAADSFEHAARLDPDNAEAFYNLALAQQKLKKLAEAEANYRRALELKPGYALALNNLAVVLAERNRPEEAEAAYLKAVECAPDYAAAHINLAGLLLKQNRPDEAERCCRRALELSTNPVAAGYDLAVMLAAQNKLDEAAAWFKRTIALAPDDVDAHVGLATMLLMGGNFAEGWPEYEWRLQHRDMPQDLLPGPVWRGESLAGRTILLCAEQGAGDAIQFIRYAQLVKQQGCTVLFGCKENLRRLLATCAGVDAVFAIGDAVPEYDVQAPLLSVPGLLGATLEAIPAQVPYLFADEQSIAEWRDALCSERSLKIGIAWQGNPIQPRDAFRSIPLAHFAGIAHARGVRVYSLQVGAGREQLNEVAADWPVVDLGAQPGDFSRTAAVMRNLDLVICSDSAPAHLAGALGVPVWLALAFAADWRWFVDRTDSPWYPTMRIFRQSRPGDWDSAFRQIEEELGRLIESKSTAG